MRPLSEYAYGMDIRTVLAELRQRADEDFLHPTIEKSSGRHQVDLVELALRVSITRARYPNRDDGEDSYAVTLSRIALDHAPDDPETHEVLQLTFGATAAVERRGGGQLVRMFRVPATH